MALIFEKGISVRAEDANNFARLAEDLAWVLRTGVPPPSEIDSAPILDCWSLTLVPQTALIGRSRGPKAGTTVTPTIHAFSPEYGWALSLHGWYRLGRRVDQIDYVHS